MTHIANCIRESVLDRSQMHISDDFSARNEPERPDSRTSNRPPSRSQSTRRGQPRYQLWPSNRTPAPTSRSNFSPEKQMALSIQRSATAMGDAIVTNDSYAARSRHGSLSRRRKVSVPELQAPTPMATLQEGLMDSPTIPGRPPAPIRQPPPLSPGHERSGSAPATHWRANPFGDAMISCITGPAFVSPQQKPISPSSQPADSAKPEFERNLPAVKPLSPILSPTNIPPAKPDLKVDTTAKHNDDDDIPPQVPPKSPSLYRKKSSPAMRQQVRNDSAMGYSNSNEPPTNTTPITGIPECSSPESNVRGRDSSRGHARKRSEQSIMDRGRPIARSARDRSRQASATSSSEKEGADTWKLPKGISVRQAPIKYAPAEREKLRCKAVEQAEKFEVLSSRDVNALAKEMRALDERCEYLRRTYKSLRAGRQKLHARMISYLKRSETVVFSRESLLKQEEALVELDLSIDDWMAKIEQAENRRLRIRQKLLEHLAAAMTLPPTSPVSDAAEATPPRSPIKAEGADSPHRIDRKDVESIRIYADGHVLNLFNDIEQAIGKMCEAC
ncbi:uncharacterized protein LTHEOB_1487 [Lasiodiplodia theobromae]|uniref:Up-regulated during septation protein 1 domain-containing protein n=1 Tax=Lasiodiplodia theobromae TaxID=45133 RepID=A0A5N5DMM0_9PEZI|nr:uncharacterized protein LTHEOB_1487 [Lasiodiplodia theobromae]KAB2579176.1 hypothetical protein DBV05_g2222 [Lasiodiplodia theobromae]KAF4537296.1 hypothetical protein LTHEOB_1487 [Lasiodiplodia theobromae]